MMPTAREPDWRFWLALLVVGVVAILAANWMARYSALTP